MNVTKDFNMGTIISVAIFLIGQTTAGVWWAATISADVNAMRAWQIRQDDRLVTLEASSDAANTKMATVRALVEVLRDEVNENNTIILDAIQGARE